VLVTTAGVGDMQAVLNLVWAHLLPAMESNPLPEDRATEERLRARLAALALRTPQGQRSVPGATHWSGRTYRFEANGQQIAAIALDFGVDETRIRIWNAQGEQTLPCGQGGVWARGTAILDNPAARPVAASGAWTDENTYEVKLSFYETPYCPTLTCRFGENQLTFAYRTNVAFGPTEPWNLVGQAEATTS